MSDEQTIVDRREALDRWSQEHDRAQAFLTCTGPGRAILFRIVRSHAHYRLSDAHRRELERQRLDEGSVSPLGTVEEPHKWCGVECALGRGFCDVAATIRITAPYTDTMIFGGNARTHEKKASAAGGLIVEIKTGRVVAGEVIRQLTRYRDAVPAEGPPFYGEAPLLAVAHIQPLTVAARDLFARRDIYAIDLYASPEFAAYGKEAA